MNEKISENTYTLHNQVEIPCVGFGTWQAAVALLTGLVAKEMVVSSMSMFYGFSMTASGAAIAAALGGTFQSPLLIQL